MRRQAGRQRQMGQAVQARRLSFAEQQVQLGGGAWETAQRAPHLPGGVPAAGASGQPLRSSSLTDLLALWRSEPALQPDQAALDAVLAELGAGASAGALPARPSTSAGGQPSGAGVEQVR